MRSVGGVGIGVGNNNTYRKFDPDTTPILDSSDHHQRSSPPHQSSDAAAASATGVFLNNVPTVKLPKRELKSWSSLKTLTRLQLVLAILLILFESITLGVINNQHYAYYFGTCTLGTGIWVGGLGVITAGLGLGAFRTSLGNKCLMIGHFVMTIISIVADGVLIIFAGFCINELQYRQRYISYERRQREMRDGNNMSNNDAADGEAAAVGALFTGLTANESLMLIAVVTHFVSSIVSSAFMCRNMCGGKQPALTVVYLPAGGGSGGAADSVCGVEVPPGAQLIFIPNDGTRQNGSTPNVVKAL